MPAPEPRNRPAPMALPSPIMVSCRGSIVWPSSRAGCVAVDFVVMLAHLICVVGVSFWDYLNLPSGGGCPARYGVRAWWQFAGQIVLIPTTCTLCPTELEESAVNVEALDAKIVRFFTDSPRSSVLEASRVLKVARATVQSRLDRMQDGGVIGSWVPQPDPSRFGYPVVAFCSLTINQDLGHD